MSDPAKLADGIEVAWGIIANAGGGDWGKETPEWLQAASRWRDTYLPLIDPPKGQNMRPPPSMKIVMEIDRQPLTAGSAFHYYQLNTDDNALQVSIALARTYFTVPPRRLRVTIEAVE